jgi:hypothetical protein
VPSVTAWQPSDIPLDTLSTREDDSRHFVIWGALMDIVVWLRSLGLWKYEAAFRENEIDEPVLPSLTHETLKEPTRRLLGNLFELEDVGAKDLKGIAGPVRAWAALRPALVESRLPRKRPHAACRTGRRTRTAVAPLVESEGRPRASGVALR